LASGRGAPAQERERARHREARTRRLGRREATTSSSANATPPTEPETSKDNASRAPSIASAP